MFDLQLLNCGSASKHDDECIGDGYESLRVGRRAPDMQNRPAAGYGDDI